MNENDNTPEHVTIIKEGNSSGGIMLGIVVAVLLALGAVWMFSNKSGSGSDSADASIRSAADKVGAAADKVGDAAQDAAKKAQ